MAAPTYVCRWCRVASDPAGRTECPTCGAPLDVREAVTESGWTELPAIRDMARLQLGRSYCQIEGAYVPVADFNLAEGDAVYFAHHLLLWKDAAARVELMSLGRGWKRMLAGMPVLMTQAVGPGHVAFSRDQPGELVALPLQPGLSVDVREHLFMVASAQVTYDWFQSGIWFQTGSGNDTETHYPLGVYMDRFQARREPGLVLLHAGGNVFVRTLAGGETILVKPASVLFKDSSVGMQLHFEQPAGTYRTWRAWGSRYVWLRLHGPGRIAVQSAYDRFADSGAQLLRSSPATGCRW